MKMLKISLAVQIAFFALWALWLFSADSRTSHDFWLETKPVDPRDLLSGHYVTLKYDIESPDESSCKKYDSRQIRKSRKNIFVKLKPGNRLLLENGNTVTAYKLDSCSEEKNPADDAVWLKAHTGPLWGQSYLVYENLNRFYMNEKDKKLNIRSGHAAVHVKITGNDRIRLTEIEEIKERLPESGNTTEETSGKGSDNNSDTVPENTPTDTTSASGQTESPSETH